MLKQRRVVVLTDDTIRSFEFGKKTQVFAFMAMSAVVAWGVFSAVYYSGASGAIMRYRHSVGAAAKRNTHLIRKNVLLSAETKKLNQQIAEMALLIDRLESGSIAILDEQLKESSRDKQQASQKELQAKHELEKANKELQEKYSELEVAESALKKIQVRIGQRMAAIRKAVEFLPTSAKKLLKNIAESNVSALHQGGPYVPEENNENGDPDEAENLANQVLLSITYVAELEKRLKSLPVGYPEKDFKITSGFGGRIDPFTGKPAGHFGLDMNAGEKAIVMSSAAGKVLRAGRAGAYGILVEIDHGNGYTTRYGHLSKALVKKGQIVKQGQKIGRQGSTGRSTGSHLHYEVRYNNTAINPYQFLKAAKYVF